MQQATLIGLEIGRLRGLPSLDPFAGNGPILYGFRNSDAP